MDEKQQNKVCWNCNYFRRFYVKGKNKFILTEYGNCYRNLEIFEKHEVCAYWQKKRNDGINSKVCRRALTELLDNLSEIKQILQEEEKIDNE